MIRCLGDSGRQRLQKRVRGVRSKIVRAVKRAGIIGKLLAI